jgi:hypothetical protein
MFYRSRQTKASAGRRKSKKCHLKHSEDDKDAIEDEPEA